MKYVNRDASPPLFRGGGSMKYVNYNESRAASEILISL